MKKKTTTTLNRRRFLGQATALGATFLLPSDNWFQSPLSAAKGVKLGAISYSFRSMPSSADDILGYLVSCGLGNVELMGGAIETFGGAPEGPPWRRGPQTDEMKAAREAHAAEMTKWRKSTSMDAFKQLKKKYRAEGVNIEVVKFSLDRMDEDEIAFCFQIAKTLGAKGITLERSDDAVKKLAPFADQHKRLIGYHNHTKVNFNSWDEAVGLSKYQALNLDVGHYVAGTNDSPIPLIKKYHDRILNLHFKDRKKNEGPNMPWGEGDTPLVEIMQLMKAEKYPFMATVELEYPIPDDSDAVKEVKKCVEFCQEALA